MCILMASWSAGWCSRKPWTTCQFIEERNRGVEARIYHAAQLGQDFVTGCGFAEVDGVLKSTSGGLIVCFAELIP